MRAQTIATSDQADTYITRAAKTVGAPGDQAVAATKVIPFVPADEELSWFHDGSGDVARGKIAQSYALTAQFLKDQGRVSHGSDHGADRLAHRRRLRRAGPEDGCDK